MQASRDVNRRPTIVTVTPNTAIDLVIEVDEYVPGTTIRSTASHNFPAGKGICVAYALSRLGSAATVTGFVGRQSHAAFEALSSDLLKMCMIEVPGYTRTNVTIFDRSAASETHLQTEGYGVSEQHVADLRAVLGQLVLEEDLVVISGSIPQGMSAGAVRDLIEDVHVLGATTLLDSSGLALRSGVLARPTIIKPNLQELGDLCGGTVRSEQAWIVEQSRRLNALGIRCVITSRGSEGIIVCDATRGAWSARIDPSRVWHGATAGVGSGDALVAGIAKAWLEGTELSAAMRFAVACAVSNLGSRRPGGIDLAEVRALEAAVYVDEIKG